MFIKCQFGNYFNLATASQLRILRASTKEDLYYILLTHERREDAIYTTTDLKMAEFILEDIISCYCANNKICVAPFNYRTENYEGLGNK